MLPVRISLDNLRFHAFHGVFSQEKRVGGEFEVNMSVIYNLPDEWTDNISDTISYADLYDIVKKEMENPRDLIESVAIEIIRNTASSFEGIEEINVSVTKVSPPIPGINGSASVGMRWKK